MNMGDLIEKIADVAGKVSAVTGAGASVIEAARATIRLIDAVKEIAAEDDRKVLDERRKDLETRVAAHTTRTVSDLRGG